MLYNNSNIADADTKNHWPHHSSVTKNITSVGHLGYGWDSVEKYPIWVIFLKLRYVNEQGRHFLNDNVLVVITNVQCCAAIDANRIKCQDVNDEYLNETSYFNVVKNLPPVGHPDSNLDSVE